MGKAGFVAGEKIKREWEPIEDYLQKRQFTELGCTAHNKTDLIIRPIILVS